MWQRRLLTCGVALVVAFGIASPGRADVRLTELRLERQGAFTALVIPVPGRALCNHFTEEPKDSKPFRVVLDLCGTVHQLEQKNFGELPSSVVRRIRTSQYATAPQNVVRVVLDLAQEATYKVTSDDKAVTISLVAPGEVEFIPWSTSVRPTPSPAVRAANDAGPAAQATRAKDPLPPPVVATTPAAWPEAKRESATNQSAKPAAAHAPVENGEVPTTGGAQSRQQATPSASMQTPVPTPKPTVTNESSTPSMIVPKTSPPAVTGTEPEPKTAMAQPAVTMEKSSSVPAEASGPTVGEQMSAGVMVPAAHQYDSPAGPSWVGAIDAPATAPPPVQSVPQSSAPLAIAPANADSMTTPSSAPAVKAQPEGKLPLMVRLRQKFVGSPGEEKTVVDAQTDSAALMRIRALAALAPPPARAEGEDSTAAAVAPRRPIDRAELETKIASVDPSAVPPGSALAETEGESGEEGEQSPEGERGSPVQMELSRVEISYGAADRRDPFEALVEGQRSGLWTSALPRVDALRLVGILQDDDGAMALFEDMEGYGYILHEGDPVKDGFLLTIGTNRVVFQLDEYGWVHTVALELREDASKSKRGYATEPQEE